MFYIIYCSLMTNTSYNVNDIIKAQYWELWNEDKITIEQKFFLELENILWKENVIIRNWEIEIKWEKNLQIMNTIYWWDFIKNILIKIQSS